MESGNIVVNYGQIQQAFDQNPDQFHQAVYQAADKAANGDPNERTQLLAEWSEGLNEFKSTQVKPGVMSTPRNALAARLQTVLAANSLERFRAGQKQKLSVTRPAQEIQTDKGDKFSVPQVEEVKFDNDDLFGWLGMAWKLIFKPEAHPWIAPQPIPEPIPDDARIAIFADWGTGLYGAPAIKQAIIKLDRCDVVLHLGDTYYSGANDEVTGRLVGDWPTRKGNTLNRSLNGNHEMYSGGHGYFTALQSFFHQPASCFAMQNSNWILACLDTAYKDFDLDANQVAWLMRVIEAAGSRKLILFSHHQPFSQLDSQGPKIQKALASLLQSQRIHAWYWGHEHRLVLYEPHPHWGFKGRCIGNGGFPGFRDDLGVTKGDKYNWVNLVQPNGLPKARVLDGPNFWIPEDPMGYSPHGFMILKFDGVNASESYYTPDHIAVTPWMNL